MSCADFRLDEYLDGELDVPARAEVERHLASCAACRGELEESRRLESLEARARELAAAAQDSYLRKFLS